MKDIFSLLKISILITSILLLVVTCSDDKPTDPDDGNSSDTTDTATGLTITPAVTQAPSMSWIAIDGLPADSTLYYGIVTTIAKAVDTGYAAIARADSGDFLIMPLNPSNPIGGGSVQIMITDGDQRSSDPFDLTIDSLPAAPGEFGDVVTMMQDVLTHSLRLRGISRDSLLYPDPADIPVSRLPFVLAYGVLDNPDSPNSLRALADETASVLDTSAIDFDLVGRIMAQMELRAYYEELLTSLDTATTTYVSLTPPTLKSSASPSACIPAPDYGITGCGTLSAAMEAQYNRAVEFKSAGTKVINDVISGTLSAVSLIPGAASATAVIGGGLWTRGIMEQGFIDMLPSDFADGATSFNPSETDFKEDFTTDGNWSEFLVTATSNGWQLDRIAIDAVLKLISASSTGRPQQIAPEPVNKVDNAMKGMFEDAAQTLIIEEFTEGTDKIQICANSWSNINCVGISYSDVVTNPGILDIDSAGLTYKPKETGRSILRIETKNIFGQSNNTGTAAAINTEELAVFLDPFQAEADTNETVNFSSRVENAEDLRVTFTLSGGGSHSSNNSTSIVTTPMLPWHPPLVLHAKSLANTGLRQGKVDSDPRADSVLITYKGEDEFIIDPESICLQPRQSQNYNIVAIRGNVDSVRWFTNPANIGEIFPSGNGMVYTAPDDLAGLIQLVAIVNGIDTAYAQIDVSDCACYWEFNAPDGSQTGLMSIASESGGGLFITLSPAKSVPGPPHVSIVLGQFSGLGSYDSLTVIYTDPGTNPSVLHIWTSMDTAVARPQMIMSEYEPGDYMIAHITGELNQFIPGTDPLEYLRFQISLEFRAEFSGGVNETMCSASE